MFKVYSNIKGQIVFLSVRWYSWSSSSFSCKKSVFYSLRRLISMLLSLNPTLCLVKGKLTVMLSCCKTTNHFPCENLQYCSDIHWPHRRISYAQTQDSQMCIYDFSARTIAKNALLASLLFSVLSFLCVTLLGKTRNFSVWKSD